MRVKYQKVKRVKSHNLLQRNRANALGSAMGKMQYSILLISVSVLSSSLAAQLKEKSESQFLEPDIDERAKGHAALESFRSFRWSGDFSFLIELKHMPRRGRSSLFKGQLWGTWVNSGPLNRVRLTAVGTEDKDTRNLIVKNGNEPYVISQIDDDNEVKFRKLSDKELFYPLFAGLVYTPFDLQMPFIYWDNYIYEGYDRTKGRSVYTYVFYPPDSLKKENPDFGIVRLSLDVKFKVPVKIEIMDSDGIPAKTFKIISFKKVENEWIPKSIDLFDERSRDKTRFTVVAAAFNLNLPGKYFASQPLDLDTNPVSLDKFKLLK